MPGRHRLVPPRHDETRASLRALGVVLLIAGGILAAIGFIDFFSAFGSHRAPSLFWCAFLGLPLLGVGLAITKMGFLGTIARYTASEITPVGADAANEMVRRTRGSVRDLARSVAEGLRGDDGEDRLECAACGTRSDSDARFCKSCGASLTLAGARPQICSACSRENDPDARFCEECGQPFGSA